MFHSSWLITSNEFRLLVNPLHSYSNHAVSSIPGNLNHLIQYISSWRSLHQRPFRALKARNAESIKRVGNIIQQLLRTTLPGLLVVNFGTQSRQQTNDDCQFPGKWKSPFRFSCLFSQVYCRFKLYDVFRNLNAVINFKLWLWLNEKFRLELI